VELVWRELRSWPASIATIITVQHNHGGCFWHRHIRISSSTTQSIHLSGANLVAFNWGNAGGDPEAARASLLPPSLPFFFTYEVRVGYLGIFLSPDNFKG
jgi:hypothetical protein